MPIPRGTGQLAGDQGLRALQADRQVLKRRRFEEAPSLCFFLEQELDFAPQVGVPVASLVEKRVPGFRRTL
jgi:hypothetical protein